MSFDERWIQRGTDLMISISGVRGKIPAGLDPINMVHFARAFASITGPRIVVGNDSRPTGDAIKQIFIGTLIASGKHVIDCGLAPTPTIKAAVKLKSAHAGVVVSASHNPLEWNGFKFLRKGGFFFGSKEGEQLLAAIRSEEDQFQSYKKFGSYEKLNAIDLHIKDVLRAIPNVAAIKRRRYRVVVDAVAGAGREALPLLLKALGCQVVPLFCDATDDGSFPRPPEPTPSALKKFGSLVKSKKAAVGFALDPDADRLVTGSPERGAVNEEYTLPLALLGLTPPGRNAKPVIVLNLSSASITDQVFEPKGYRVVRASVGEANVVEMMQKKKAILGGEGNGGVIHPGIASYGRDSLIGAALILSAMTRRNAKTLDDLLDDMPPLFMKKTKQSFSGNLDRVFDQLRRAYPEAAADTRDGLHLLMMDGAWLHLRASNTEPIVRLIAQAPSRAQLQRLLDDAGRIVADSDS